MSLPKKDLPLDLPPWAHTVLSAKAKTSGAESLKSLCESILEREAAKEAMAARYLAAQLDASGVEASDWERHLPRSGGFADSGFGGAA